MSHSIDIKAVNTDISAASGRIEHHKCDFSGAFFEFPGNSRKGHRFFIGVFRKLSIYFLGQAGVSGSLTLSDAPAFFVFRKLSFGNPEGSE